MAERKFLANYEPGMLRLELMMEGLVPIDQIEEELVSVSVKHSLPPAGGLFRVRFASIDGPGYSELGGMYVPLDKVEAVTAELNSLGYIIV